MKRVLLFAATTGYQTRMFDEAASHLGIELLLATDRCDQLDDPWRDGALAVRFGQATSVLTAASVASRESPIDGVLAVGDRPTVAAAHAARRLGLPGNSPAAAEAARDKRQTRECLARAGLLVPEWRLFHREVPTEAARPVAYPVVVKPVALSGSRGVIRADEDTTFDTAYGRVQQLLASPDVRALNDPANDHILIESFITGTEFALEAVLSHGRLCPLALFDKPEPLDGPFFEETVYVTPSGAPSETQTAIVDTVQRAALALGLEHGPIHAECRVNERGVYVLEVAARPIGGLCARAVMFENVQGQRCGLEELLLRHASGEAVDHWTRESQASGVMMIPIDRAGIFKRIDGVEGARAVTHITDLTITAKPDQLLVPLPEGASYLGFIFARASTRQDVVHALRLAHSQLVIVADRIVPVVVPA